MKVVLLDTGPLGLLTNPKASAEATACGQWLQFLLDKDVRVYVPEIVDYELRRELVRGSKTAGIARLEAFTQRLIYLQVTTAAWRQAAQFWAQARQQGQPTAGSRELDGDVILAAQAATLELPVGDVVVATTNAPHLSRYVLAEDWQNIRPAEAN